jgi:hypothetical protein
MVIVPLVEMMMQYMSGLREICMLVVMFEEVEGCDRKYEPSGNLRRDVYWEGWGRCWVGGVFVGLVWVRCSMAVWERRVCSQ